MPNFRKKPVVIEARQLQEDNHVALSNWCAGTVRQITNGPRVVVIHTLEGEMQAQPGDWIIKGVNGEFYPCKPDIFAKTYEEEKTTGMSYSRALDLIKQGKRVQRAGWNGKGMFVFLVPGSTFMVNREPLLSILGEGTSVNYHGHIDMKTADGMIVPWLCSQTDALAEDWQLV